MNFIFSYEGYEEYLVRHNERSYGDVYLFKFDNNYGASVIKRSDGRVHIGVTRFDEDDNGPNYNITHCANITDDILSYADDTTTIRDILEKIKGL